MDDCAVFIVSFKGNKCMLKGAMRYFVFCSCTHAKEFFLTHIPLQSISCVFLFISKRLSHPSGQVLRSTTLVHQNHRTKPLPRRRRFVYLPKPLYSTNSKQTRYEMSRRSPALFPFFPPPRDFPGSPPRLQKIQGITVPG